MFNISFKTKSTVVNYNINSIGNDLHISITGGDIHIGCACLVNNGNYNLLSVINHKEHEIIKPLAKRLIKYDKITILISAGIHVEDISLDEINEIIQNNEVAIDKIDEYISSITTI